MSRIIQQPSSASSRHSTSSPSLTERWCRRPASQASHQPYGRTKTISRRAQRRAAVVAAATTTAVASSPPSSSSSSAVASVVNDDVGDRVVVIWPDRVRYNGVLGFTNPPPVYQTYNDDSVVRAQVRQQRHAENPRGAEWITPAEAILTEQLHLDYQQGRVAQLVKPRVFTPIDAAPTVANGGDEDEDPAVVAARRKKQKKLELRKKNKMMAESNQSQLHAAIDDMNDEKRILHRAKQLADSLLLEYHQRITSLHDRVKHAPTIHTTDAASSSSSSSMGLSRDEHALRKATGAVKYHGKSTLVGKSRRKPKRAYMRATKYWSRRHAYHDRHSGMVQHADEVGKDIDWAHEQWSRFMHAAQPLLQSSSPASSSSSTPVAQSLAQFSRDERSCPYDRQQRYDHVALSELGEDLEMTSRTSVEQQLAAVKAVTTATRVARHTIANSIAAMTGHNASSSSSKSLIKKKQQQEQKHDGSDDGQSDADNDHNGDDDHDDTVVMMPSMSTAACVAHIRRDMNYTPGRWYRDGMSHNARSAIAARPQRARRVVVRSLIAAGELHGSESVNLGGAFQSRLRGTPSIRRHYRHGDLILSA